MTAVKDTDLRGATITYNGVQFGGDDSAFQSLPPSDYTLKAQAVYDEAGRSVTHFGYVLTVNCTFYADSEDELSTILATVRRRLLRPGARLTLTDTGLGVPDLEPDMIYGPLPQSFSAPRTHGVLASDTVWLCHFNGPPCKVLKSSSGKLTFSAFNYQTTWANDFEGRNTRTISGYYTIPYVRSNGVFGDTGEATNGKASISDPAITNVAEELRDDVKIMVPTGYRRTQNTWDENKAKNRINFRVVDETLPGRAYPPGITKITNDAFEMVSDPLTFSQAQVTLAATMTVAPDRPASLAGVYFLQLAVNKQNNMERRIGKGKKAAVVPVRFVTRAGLYDNARTTSFLMQWKTTGCLQDMFFNEPWEAVPNTNYKRWRTSIESTWGNRGILDTKENTNEDAIFSICDNVSTVRVGLSGSDPKPKSTPSRYSLPCPDIKKENSWLSYDVQVSVFARVNNTIMRRMVKPFVSAGDAETGLGTASSSDTTETLGIPHSTEDDGVSVYTVSQDGPPMQFVLVQAKGRRVNFPPVFPKLLTIGKDRVKIVPADPSMLGGAVASEIQHKIVAKFGKCEIHEMRGFQWYFATKYVEDYGSKFNPVVCATTQAKKDIPTL